MPRSTFLFAGAMALTLWTGGLHPGCSTAAGAVATAKSIDAKARRIDAPWAAAKVRAEVRRALAGLTAPRWTTRQTANAAIMRLPAAAVPLLEKALRSGTLGPGAALPLARDIPTLKLTVIRNAHTLRMVHWINRQMLAAYKNPPNKTPAWDAAARTVCRLLTRVHTAWLTAAQKRRLKSAANFIWKQGLGQCPSAVTAYSEARVKALEHQTPLNKLLPWVAFAARHLEAHAPAFCVFATSNWYAQLLFRASPGTPSPLGIIYQHRAVASLQKLMAQRGVPRSVLSVAVHWSFVTDALRPGDDSWLARYTLAPQLRAMHKNNYYSWLISAKLALEFYQDDTYNDPARLPADYKIVAKYATKSWRLAPYLTVASSLMLRACAIAGRPPAEFNKWFKRLRVVAPNDYRAYLEKLTYLQMNSPGSMKQAMLTFGRECLAEGNWAAHIPMILVIARERLDHYSMDMYKYYAKPAVWRDIHAAFAGFLRHYPHDTYHRSWYAMLACWCGHWNTAARQFKIIGPHGAMGIFHSRAVFHYYRREALARAAAGARGY